MEPRDGPGPVCRARLMAEATKMEWRGKTGGRRPGGGGGRDGRQRIAALVNGRAAVRVLGSASLRADAVDHRRASCRVGGRGGKGGPGGRRPEGGGGRDGQRRMAALVSSRAAVRLLGSGGRPRSARGAAGGAQEQRRAWRAGAEMHDRQQPTTTRVYAPRSENGTSDNKTLPEYSPRTACDGCAIGSRVQKTGFS